MTMNGKERQDEERTELEDNIDARHADAVPDHDEGHQGVLQKGLLRAGSADLQLRGISQELHDTDVEGHVGDDLVPTQ